MKTHRVECSDVYLTSLLFGRLRNKDHWSPGVQANLGNKEALLGWETPKSRNFKLYFTQKIKHVLFCYTLNLSNTFNIPIYKKLPKNIFCEMNNPNGICTHPMECKF